MQRSQLAPGPQLEHTHNPWLLDMFSEDKKANYKAVLLSLAGLAEELYNVTALLAMLFLSHGSLQPLCHSLEMGPLIHVPQSISHQVVWAWIAGKAFSLKYVLDRYMHPPVCLPLGPVSGADKA